MNTPVAVFAFNRADHLQKTIEALEKNRLASETGVHVFSDGARSFPFEPGKERKLAAQIGEVREYLDSINPGFKSFTVHKREENYGLARNIRTGVTRLIEEYGTVIVLEDDLVTTPNFLEYMNSMLDFYRDDKRIWSVTGFQEPLEITKDYPHDVYLSHRICSLGWGTWKDRWEKADWEIKKFHQVVHRPVNRLKFNRGGNLAAGLTSYYESEFKKVWAIVWNYNQFINKAMTLYPVTSKLRNIGCDDSGSNDLAGNSDYYARVPMDRDEKPIIPVANIKLNRKIIENFRVLYGGRTSPNYYLREVLEAWRILPLVKRVANRYRRKSEKRKTAGRLARMGSAGIYMLHRVGEAREGLSPNRNLSISEERLEEVILFHKDKGDRFVTLDELSNQLDKKGDISSMVLFTFDDGYGDNFTKALPIFERYNVPFTIYVNTGHLHGESIPWWYVLDRIIRTNSSLELGNGTVLKTDSQEDKEKAFKELRRIILPLCGTNCRENLKALIPSADWDFKAESTFLTKDEIRKLSEHPLVTIAAHTVHHYNTSVLSVDDWRKEVIDNRDELEEITGKLVRHFAYPFGTRNEISQDNVSVLREWGIMDTAVLSGGGPVINGDKWDKLLLPRIFLGNDKGLE